MRYELIMMLSHWDSTRKVKRFMPATSIWFSESADASSSTSSVVGVMCGCAVTEGWWPPRCSSARKPRERDVYQVTEISNVETHGNYAIMYI